MKKILLSVAIIATSFTGFAQVGVGTTAPETTLHVNGTGLIQDNTVLIGDNFDLVALGLEAADVSTYSEQNINNLRIRTKKVFTNIDATSEAFTLIDGGNVILSTLAGGTAGSLVSSLNLRISDGSAPFNDNRSVFWRFSNLAHVQPALVNSLVVSNLVDGAYESSILMNNSGDISFHNGAAWATSTMVISDGKVGIGTGDDAPKAELEVKGSIVISANTNAPTAGMIRFYLGRFQGYNGAAWLYLD